MANVHTMSMNLTTKEQDVIWILRCLDPKNKRRCLRGIRAIAQRALPPEPRLVWSNELATGAPVRTVTPSFTLVKPGA
jgi:hypothetical protein